MIKELKQQLEHERIKYKQLWELNCLQLNEFDKALSDKEELAILQDRLRGTEAVMPPVRTVPATIASTSKVASWVTGGEKAATPRRGSHLLLRCLAERTRRSHWMTGSLLLEEQQIGTGGLKRRYLCNWLDT